MKKCVFVLLMFFSACAIGKTNLNCSDIGYWAAETTMMKDNGSSLDDAINMFNIRENMPPEEKSVLVVMAKTIYDNPSMPKDQANDFYKETCEAA